jgi:hypothetical protein
MRWVAGGRANLQGMKIMNSSQKSEAATMCTVSNSLKTVSQGLEAQNALLQKLMLRPQQVTTTSACLQLCSLGSIGCTLPRLY